MKKPTSPAPRPYRASTERKKLMRQIGVPIIRKGKALLKHGGVRFR